jgi:hypothetical protein
MTHDRNNAADTEHAPRSAAIRPGAFRPGNPGRPRGARNRTTLACLALLEGKGAALTRKAVELALTGDTVALKLCLERLLPKGRADPPPPSRARPRLRRSGCRGPRLPPAHWR